MTFISKGNPAPVHWHRPAWLKPGRRLPDTEITQSIPLSVAFVSSIAQVPNALGSSSFPEPLEGKWIYEVLERSGLESQFTLLYALVFQVNTLAAVAPAFVMDMPMESACPEKLLKTLKAIGRVVPSILYQRTLFVGYPSGAEGTIGIVPGIDRREVLLALQREFKKKARDFKAELIIWRGMPAGISQEFETLTKRGRLFRAKCLPSTILKFKSQNKEDYFAQLTAAHRWAVKRNLKRSAAAVCVSTQVLQHPAPEVLEEMYGLFRQTYLRSKIKFEELNMAWFAQVAALPTTYFMAMREAKTGEMIAATAYFDKKPMLIARHVGFDYSKPLSWMLYYRLWDALVDWALSNGFTSIYSGPMSYAAKIQTGHELIPLFNYLWHRNPFMHAIYKAVAQRLDWAALDDDLAKYFKAHPDASAAASAPCPNGSEAN
jgi:Peptidogalycan biosysnthesis/recognition